MIVNAFIKTREWEKYWFPGLEGVLIGEDPLQIERLWHKMYASMWLYGRRGAGIGALTGIDTALWDIKGKAMGKPAYELIWTASSIPRTEKDIFGPRDRVKPYGTVYPSGKTPDEIKRSLSKAVKAGFDAVKLEEGEGGFGRLGVRHDVELAQAAREAVGDERDLMIDVQYAWQDFTRALETIRAIERFRPYFVEAPLAPDMLDGYRRLAEAVDTRIACGDGGFTTRFEFQELMDRGSVDVVQPSSVRSGGITEMLRIAALAHDRGILCIPHCYAWKIGVAAAAHVAAVAPNMPYIEMSSPDPYSPLISELLKPDPVPQDGFLEVPRRPGLGYELNEKTVEKYRTQPS